MKPDQTSDRVVTLCAPERADFHPCAGSSRGHDAAEATTTVDVPDGLGGSFRVPLCAPCAQWIDSYQAARELGLDDAAAAESAHDDSATDDHEVEDGSCPDCSRRAEWRECHECARSAWIIDCGHYPQPRPISAGLSDGSHSDWYYCDDCARANELSVVA